VGNVAMNPHVRSVLWAGVVTSLVAFGLIARVDTPVSRGWLGDLLNVCLMPGFYLADYWRLKGGPDGLPDLRYVFALSFLVYWAIIALGQTLWRWINAG